MTDDPFDDEPTEEEMARLGALLGDPNMWEAPDSADEDAIVAAILAEAGSAPDLTGRDDGASAGSSLGDPDLSNVIPLSRARRWLAPVAAGVAAALVILAGFALVTAGDDEPEGVVLVLEGTDLAPGATAEAVIAPLRSGTRIVLDVRGLEPAEPGTYYEAWMRKDAEVGVSAGTFHLRGGDGAIELWSGVSPDDYPLVTVTVQREAESESSGVVVLRGLLDGAGN